MGVEVVQRDPRLRVVAARVQAFEQEFEQAGLAATTSNMPTHLCATVKAGTGRHEVLSQVRTANSTPFLQSPDGASRSKGSTEPARARWGCCMLRQSNG
jgi:hypothetical protein